MTFKFGNIEGLKRNLKIEGDIGTPLGLPGGITLRILAATDANPRWKAGGDKYRREIRALVRANASDDRQKQFFAEHLTKLIVKDWEGVTDDEGNVVPFTREACEAFLLEADDAVEAILGTMSDTKNFRGERIEAVIERIKN